jgi:hypothetical protein
MYIFSAITAAKSWLFSLSTSLSTAKMGRLLLGYAIAVFEQFFQSLILIG